MTGRPPPSGRRSRPWSPTGGKVHDLDGDSGIHLDTQVTAVPDSGVTGPPSGSQHARIISLCRTGRAVAELAAHLGLPVGVAGVMVAELRAAGQVTTRAPLDMTADSVVTDALLRRVRDGLLNVS
ncbi:DUF742 domain-containing protein [Streptomyces oceani]|uniref:DUF742 domain-containing protein n=1 Tax=Streptomyces oceani TaxID=1075402 RepID=A0A1E7KQ21_9ACTN|nr:DUF742 domain-containing protein [Streptomyces oceani]OEV06030.1 hypothetical protein AN216_00725 [Streptomyces oceani]